MQIIRTIIWVLLLVGLLLFSISNWTVVTVKIWNNIEVDTKVPAIVIMSFLIGFVPMWLYYRGSKWQMRRKIASLENAVRTAATTPVAPGPTGDDAETIDTTPRSVAEPETEPMPDAMPDPTRDTLSDPMRDTLSDSTILDTDNPLSPDDDGKRDNDASRTS